MEKENAGVRILIIMAITVCILLTILIIAISFSGNPTNESNKEVREQLLEIIGMIATQVMTIVGAILILKKDNNG